MANTIIEIKEIYKSFHVGEQDVEILKNISFDVEKGDFLVIFGPSGCGKSTLLHTMLGLEPPTKGKIIILEKDFYDNQDEDSRSDFRKKHIGMIYQQPNWVKALNVIENVAFPLSLLGYRGQEPLKKAKEMLDIVKMTDWSNYIPTELSSGQQQKIAAARAMISNPEIIIADEPTGNLDYESGQELMSLLEELNRQGKTIAMVTHDLEYIKYAKSAIRIFNGELIGKYKGKEKDQLLKEVKSKRGNGGNGDKLDMKNLGLELSDEKKEIKKTK